LGIAVTPPPVGLLTDLTGWRAFVHRAISPPVLLPAKRWSGLDAEARSVDVQDRIGYHAELLALQTPDLHRIVATGEACWCLTTGSTAPGVGCWSVVPPPPGSPPRSPSWGGRWNWLSAAPGLGPMTARRWSI
jgi:hypothetical protein